MNRVYTGHNPGSPPDSGDAPACECGEELCWPWELKRGECDRCHRVNDESEMWIDRHEKRTA